MSNIFNPKSPSQAAPATVQKTEVVQPLVRDTSEVDTTRRKRKRSSSLLDLLLEDDLSPTTL